MKKKVLGIGLALAMALSMGAMAAPSKFADQFAEDREQGPEWFYMYDNGEGWKEMVTAESLGYEGYGDNWRLPKEIGDDEGDYTSFTNWEGIKSDINGGEGKTIAAAAYKAPSDGTVVIAPWNHAMSYNTGEPDYEFLDVESDVTVRILHNDKELYSYTGKDATAASKEITVDVKAGDYIYFVSTSNGSDKDTLVSYDSVSVDFTAAQGGADEGTDETPEKNPNTGEATTALPVMAAVVSLAALVLAKKAKKA